MFKIIINKKRDFYVSRVGRDLNSRSVYEKKKKRFYSTHTLAITAQTRDKKKKKTGHSNYVKNKLRVEFAREVFIKAPPM